MANNDYYHASGAGMPGSPISAPVHSFQDPLARTTSPSDYAPSYRTTDPNQPPYEHVEPSLPSITNRNNSTAYRQPAPMGAAGATDTPTSPFATPFDDPAYPMDAALRNHQQADPYNSQIRRDSLYSPSMMTASQYGSVRRGPETGYHGAQGPLPPIPVSENSSSDAIPLQDRPHKDFETTDHIYDAPPGGPQGVLPTYGAQQPDGNTRKGRLGYGELGMFRSGGKKRIPWVVYALTIAQVGVFIGEIIKNGIMTGSPIQTKPQFNYMIGPSTAVLINMGARYVPCMHNIDAIQGSDQIISWTCPNATTDAADCTLSELCGFGGIPEPKYNGDENQSPSPNQWWRFIIPIFMHAGLIHIGFNLFLQLTIGKEVEVLIGPIRFFIIYMAAGIFGFVFGGNYAGTAIATTGASGSLFGIMALVLLDLAYSWRERSHPVRELIFLLLEIVVSFVLGLLIPYIDNFAHIGGFIVGLCAGVSLLHSPNALRRRIGDDSTYNSMHGGPEDHDHQPFYKNPVGFFKGRKPLWWAWWLVRAGALVLVIVAFIVLTTNFYKSGQTCSWCKYLNCIDVNDWCDAANLQFVNTTTTS
jgi:membrane associated rhomboid family serine protease